MTSRAAIEERVKEFYTYLFRSETPVPQSRTHHSDVSPPIVTSEIRSSISLTKNEGAAEMHKISGQMMRYGGPALHSLLFTGLSHYPDRQECPSQWKASNTILIHKKGDRADLDNYRPIALLSLPYKLFSKVLITRMERRLDEGTG